MRKRPVLISMWARQRLRDAIHMGTWPSKTFLMQPSGRAGEIPFVRAATKEGLWPPGVAACIGRSVVESLHPIALTCVLDICARHTNLVVSEPRQRDHDTDLKAASHLAEWLLANASGPAAKFPTEKQLSYLFASGAHRARAISAMLKATGKTAITHVVDIGTGVGLIPWLLCNDIHTRSAELFEPDGRRHPALERLWAFRPSNQGYTIAHQRAENVPFSTPADLIMFCQCLFRIEKAERRAVLERAWQALDPGGVLLVNEMPKEAAGRDPLRDTLLTRDEIASLMPGIPCLFTSHTDWQRARDPHTVSAHQIGSAGLFVSIRPE